MALDAPGHPVRDDVRGRRLSQQGAAPARREWLDWARGVAVLLMVLAHVVDSWTRDADRDRAVYYWAAFLGGLAAPAFLFMAGLGTALSGASKEARGVAHRAATRALVSRGLVIFGLAFVFRLQALVLGLGHPADLLRVDILNVMGPSLMGAGVVWGLARGAGGRIAAAVATTALLAFAAPLASSTSWIDGWPAALLWYLRPTPGRTNFTLLPWAGFVTAGLAAGVALVSARGVTAERRVLGAVAFGAAALAGIGWWASFQPSVYPPGRSTFWGASPAFFAIRLGLVAGILPVCFALRDFLPRRLAAALATLGAASLFVYWVHVELVYGGVAILIKHRLPIEVALAGTAGVAYGLVRLVPWTRRWVAAPAGRLEPLRRLVARLL